MTMNNSKILKLAKKFYSLANNSIKISLTPTEEKIFKLLLSVVKEKTPDTVLRVAGGWVRDSLLGKKSNDIDIAVNNMSGEDFANLVYQYMQENQIKSKGVSVVKANPAQSKHLATAMINIFGLPIDFVNLRKEQYSDTRIPTIEPGTPEEDATRRDLTINSLFYNVNEGKVEDFVGGIEDLTNKIARTPMDPVQTFLDDPLRILRTIRFAAKYDLKLAPELVQAAKDPRVQEAFKAKISPERIWKELGGALEESGSWKAGALAGPNPHRAAELIQELGLRELLFDLPKEEMERIGLSESMTSFDEEQNNPHHDLDIWQHTMLVLKNLVEKTKEETREDAKTYLIRNLAAIFHDIGKRYTGIHGTHNEGYRTFHGHEDISTTIAKEVLTKMRAPSEIIDRVLALVAGHMSPHQLHDASSKAHRKYIQQLGPDWEHAIDLAIADAYGKQGNVGDPSIEQKYEELRAKMREAQQSMGQTSGKLIQKFKGIGHDLMQLGLKGKQIGDATKLIEDALLGNPEMTREEAISLVKEFFGIV